MTFDLENYSLRVYKIKKVMSSGLIRCFDVGNILYTILFNFFSQSNSMLQPELNYFKIDLIDALFIPYWLHYA